MRKEGRKKGTGDNKSESKEDKTGGRMISGQAWNDQIWDGINLACAPGRGQEEEERNGKEWQSETGEGREQDENRRKSVRSEKTTQVEWREKTNEE